MKRFLLLCMIFTILLTAVVPMTAYAEYTLPQYIRVGLMYGSSSVSALTLTSDSGFALGDYQERDLVRGETTAETTVVVKVEGDILVVYNSAGSVIYTGASSVGVCPNASGMGQVIGVNGVSYRGGIHCVKSGNAMNVINVVSMDHYLYGVISREMSPSWHPEALKAQAVCARNYAAQSMNKHQGQGFDLCADVHCQAYSGTKAETNGSYAPVDETTGQVLTYDGSLAQLFYSSSMGKTTEDVKNVWGNSLPYLVAVDNNYEDTENIPNGVWEGYLSCEEATTIMRNKGYDVGTVTDINALEYSENRRVIKMEVIGTNGSKVFEREGCRTIFNTITKSQEFTVTGDGVEEQVATFQVTDGATVVEATLDQIVILTGSGRGEASGILYASNGREQLSYGESVSAKENTGFYFSGVGWGHGVGMSQYGAKGMAEAGFSYRDILLHYFTGTSLENAY